MKSYKSDIYYYHDAFVGTDHEDSSTEIMREYLRKHYDGHEYIRVENPDSVNILSLSEKNVKLLIEFEYGTVEKISKLSAYEFNKMFRDVLEVGMFNDCIFKKDKKIILKNWHKCLIEIGLMKIARRLYNSKHSINDNVILYMFDFIRDNHDNVLENVEYNTSEHYHCLIFLISSIIGNDYRYINMFYSDITKVKRSMRPNSRIITCNMNIHSSNILNVLEMANIGFKINVNIDMYSEVSDVVDIMTIVVDKLDEPNALQNKRMMLIYNSLVKSMKTFITGNIKFLTEKNVESLTVVILRLMKYSKLKSFIKQNKRFEMLNNFYDL